MGYNLLTVLLSLIFILFCAYVYVLCVFLCTCVQVALCVSLIQHVCLQRLQFDIVCLSQLLSTYFIFKTNSLAEPEHTDLSKLAGQ